MAKKKEQEIIIHKDQSTIFDFTEDIKTSSVPDVDISAIQLKTKPPYHKELFPNVLIIQISSTKHLVLIAKEYNIYETQFYFKRRDGSFTGFIPINDNVIHVFKTSREIKKTPEGWNKVDDFKHFMIDKYYAQKFFINPYDKKYIELYKEMKKALLENDFDKIFQILKQIK